MDEAFGVEAEIAEADGRVGGALFLGDEDAADGWEEGFDGFDAALTDVEVGDCGVGFVVDYGVPFSDSFLFSETGLFC